MLLNRLKTFLHDNGTSQEWISDLLHGCILVSLIVVTIVVCFAL